MDFKDKLTIISDDLNHNEITEQEARQRIYVLLGVVGRSEQLVEEQSNWLIANTSLEVEKIVDFKEHFK